MDRRELFPDVEELLRAALDSAQAGLWTAVPGTITKFNPAAMTVEVQPAIKARLRQPDGSQVSVALPLLVDVPVFFPGGGGFTLTFPIQPGDECLVVFACRCIDSWWQSGGVQEPLEARMHDLSDGFAFVGVRSRSRVPPAVHTSHVQLRSDNGEDWVEITTAGTIKVEALDVVIHGRHSFSWDVDGYGQRITSLGGGTYEIHTWQIGAVTTSVNDPINPPEGP